MPDTEQLLHRTTEQKREGNNTYCDPKLDDTHTAVDFRLDLDLCTVWRVFAEDTKQCLH